MCGFCTAFYSSLLIILIVRKNIFYENNDTRKYSRDFNRRLRAKTLYFCEIQCEMRKENVDGSLRKFILTISWMDGEISGREELDFP